MMEKLKKSKTSLTILLIVVVLLGVYWFMRDDGGSVVSTSSGSEEIIGQELFNELDKLKTLNQMDTNFFDDPVWKSLIDKGVQVSPNPLGRSNPFVRPN